MVCVCISVIRASIFLVCSPSLFDPLDLPLPAFTLKKCQVSRHLGFTADYSLVAATFRWTALALEER